MSDEVSVGSATTSPSFSSGVVARYALLALVDALGLYAVMTLGSFSRWGMLTVVVVLLVLVNAVYATKRFIPLKYLVPGLVLLLVYQVYVVAYTAALSFTNESDFNSLSQPDAVATILAQNERRVPDSPQYQLTVLQKGGKLSFLVTDPQGQVELGNDSRPLAPVDNAEMSGSKAVGLPGYQSLDLAGMAAQQQALLDLRVPFSEDPNDGSLRTQDGSTAYVYRPTAAYDAAAGTVKRKGVVYSANDNTGYFESADGKRLTPGYKVNVGFDNYTRILTNKAIRGPFFQILVWTIVFALMAVVTTFAVGLMTAMVLNDKKMRFRRFYRSLLILPYAVPAFLSTGVFKGMLNQEFGFVNQVMLFGANLDWLGDPWLAKLSLILVNLWLGYPYMFLVCTGALQAIPTDVVEAGSIDGASGWQIFRHIKLPYIVIATAPLLIATFAFNFNNFNLIQILTGGGPTMTSAEVSAGYTDILITYVYKLAFGGQQALYGFASAISILIFLFVGVVSVIGFRQTRKLEEMS